MIEIHDAAGALVRRFASDEIPDRPRDGVYFTHHWLADPDLPGTTAGHHRFVWDLRRERPRALDYDYSIAAVAGRETPPAPQGALVPPGTYEVRLTVDGQILRQTVGRGRRSPPRPGAADYAELDRLQGEIAELLAGVRT